MRARATVAIAAALAVLLLGATHEYRVDWAALEHAVSRYFQEPGSSAAREIARLLPPGIADRHTGVFDVAASGRIFGQLEALDSLIKRGRPEAVDVAFALIAISDGVFTEELLTMIAGSLDVNPDMFLRALKSNRTRPLASCDIAFDTGLQYVDDPSGELRALERRLEKVQQVQDAALAQEKQCVIKSLHDTIIAIRENTR
jgi:hypothetical protein